MEGNEKQVISLVAPDIFDITLSLLCCFSHPIAHTAAQLTSNLMCFLSNFW